MIELSRVLDGVATNIRESRINMGNKIKAFLLKELIGRFGNIHRLEGSQSLYDIGDAAGRIYIRYSKVHQKSSILWVERKGFAKT